MHGAAAMPCSDDNEIRRSCFPRDQFGRQLKGGPPFYLLEVLALGPESPAHLIQARAHRPAMVLGGLVIEGDASRRESRMQWQTCDANEGRLKSVRQSKSQLDPLFAVTRDVDVHHHGCKRSPLLRGAAIGNGAD
jgi:hypothetical protein